MSMYKPEGVFENLEERNRMYSIEELEDALKTGKILHGRVKEVTIDLALVIEMGSGIEAKIEFNDLEYSPIGKATKPVAAASKIGKQVNFKVISVGTVDNKYKIKLSRADAMREAYENYVSKLKIGDIIDARINHIEKYGAFCDVACGLTYLLPIENLCITRIANASVALRDVKDIKAVVSAINKDNMLVLSHKELLGTWEEEASKFKPGQIVEGVVHGIEDYGIFIGLTPNLSGLAEHTNGLEVGDIVAVYIKTIVPSKMKIKLSIANHEHGDVDQGPLHFEYKVTDGHIDQWVYNPEDCQKEIKTVFTQPASDIEPEA